jgi:hypothetical protein
MSPFFLVLVLQLSQDSTALRIHDIQQNNHEFDDQSVKQIVSACGSQNSMPRLGPIVASIAKYFEKTELTIYPWVITMVAAMRYGSSVVEISDTSTPLDHDIDFLIVHPRPTPLTETREHVNRWRSFLQEKYGLESSDHTQNIVWGHKLLNPSVAEKGAQKTPGGKLGYPYHIFTMVKQWSEVGEKLVDDKIFERRLEQYHLIVDRNGSQHFMIEDDDQAERKAIENAIAGRSAGIDFWFTAKPTNRSWSSVESEILNDFHTGEQYQKKYTVVDFWFTEDKLPANYLPSATNPKKAFFLGSTFPFPSDMGVIYDGLMSTFLPGHPAKEKTTNLCDFSRPHGLFEEEFPESVQLSKISNKCRQLLESHSLASFDFCEK